MREKVAYEALGATLFIPASHKNLEEILLHNSLPLLKSLVIDTEDGLDGRELETSMKRIEALLVKITNPKIILFLRPRNATV